MAGPSIPGYERLTQIGKGGFSRVYKGEQTKLKRRVAIKVLNFGLNDEADRHSFERECELMGRVSTHPNIVTVHDTEFTTGGQPCIVMEHYPGGSLADLIGEIRQLNPKEVLEVGVSIASALEASHQAGVLHCDLKPQNILISEFGQPALGDFGISTFTEERTRTGGDAGAGFTLAYAAPEIVEGASPSVQSDLYSLAATLYTSLAGRRPFFYPNADGQKPSAAEQARRILLEDPTALTEVGVPTELDQLIRGVMAKEPSQRPDSAADFARSLHQVGQRLGFGTSSPRIADQGALPVFEPSAEFTDQSASSPVAEHSVIAPSAKPEAPIAPPLAGAAVAEASPGVDHTVSPSPPLVDDPSDHLTELRVDVAAAQVATPPIQPPPNQTSDGHSDGYEATELRVESPAPTVVEAPAPTVAPAPAPAPALTAAPTAAPAAPIDDSVEAGAATPPRRVSAALIGLLGLVLVGGIVFVVARDPGSTPTASEPTAVPASASASGVLLAPPAPRTVSASRIGTSAVLVSWSSPIDADVHYELRRTDDPGTVWAQGQESPVLIEGIDPDDALCVEVTAIRSNLLSLSPNSACVAALGSVYAEALPASCELPCAVEVSLIGVETTEPMQVAMTTAAGEAVTSAMGQESTADSTDLRTTVTIPFADDVEPGKYLIAVSTADSDDSYQAVVSLTAPAS